MALYLWALVKPRLRVGGRESLVVQNLQEATEREECVINIKQQLDEVNSYQGGLSIFEVPKSLQKLEPDAFAPHIVSIGPYHRKNEHLKEMEKHKRRLLKHVLERTKLELDVLVEAIFQIEEEIRSCYDKPIKDFTRQQFVEMMLLDACFILDLFYATETNRWERPKKYTEDPLGLSIIRGFLPFIQRDLLMMENQLPLFVLHRVYALTYGQSTPGYCVTDLALKFFNQIMPGISHNLPDYKKSESHRVHLLDVVRQSLKPSQQAYACCTHCEKTMHSVTKLRGTGIRFQSKASTKFTDIGFKGGKLLIPTLHINDSTKSIFLNLMAFEQCYPHCKSHITSYVRFMDGLINCPQDVEHLQLQHIIVHELGSEEDVAQLFNNLRREIVFDPNDFYLSKVSNDLNRHYSQNWRMWTATLKHEYLKDPWKIIALFAATFLIFLTIAQTVYTAITYHFPRS